MKTNFLYISIVLILSSCNSQNSQKNGTIIPETLLPTTSWTPTRSEIHEVTQTISASPTILPIIVTLTPIEKDHISNLHPNIRIDMGEIYETLFTVPINDQELIQYHYYADSIQGPNAIGVLPDNVFLISDFGGNQLVEYDINGTLIKNIDLASLNIHHVRDLRISNNKIILLEISYEKFRVHFLDMDGEVLGGADIPYRQSIGSGNTLESSLTGIALDCENNVLLEIEGGSKFLPLSAVQTESNLGNIQNGYPCVNQIFSIRYDPNPIIQTKDGSFQTVLTNKIGGLRILSAFNSGDIYINRTDLVNLQTGLIDETIHYFSADGKLQGVARAPVAQYYYSILRDCAVGPDGEVYCLFLQETSASVLRLNFFSTIEPLIEGAAFPVIFKMP